MRRGTPPAPCSNACPGVSWSVSVGCATATACTTPARRVLRRRRWVGILVTMAGQYPPPGTAEGPGPVSDTTDPDLASLRRRAVDPVVASLLIPEEVDELSVCWGQEPYGRDVWIRLVPRGEPFLDVLDSPSWSGEEPASPAAVAQRLADHLEDWVCETRFAWGQRRVAHYELPADYCRPP